MATFTMKPYGTIDKPFANCTNLTLVNIPSSVTSYTLYGIKLFQALTKYPFGYKIWFMNEIAEFVKTNRKAAGLTQKEFAMRSGLGLRFVRDLEQGKETVRMDKVNQALAMFGMTAVPGKLSETDHGL